MNQIQSGGQAVASSFVSFGQTVASFLPSLIGAIIILIVGIIIASLIANLIEKLVSKLHIDHQIGKKEKGRNLKISIILKEIVRWFIIFIFLMAAVSVLGIPQLSDFFNRILLYIPNVFVAVIVLAIVKWLGDLAYRLIMESTAVSRSFNAYIVAAFAKWAIYIFGILAALVQLGIAPSLMNAIAIGIIAAFSLATGLAFGLGGRDEAALVLKNLRNKMGSRD